MSTDRLQVFAEENMMTEMRLFLAGSLPGEHACNSPPEYFKYLQRPIYAQDVHVSVVCKYWKDSFILAFLPKCFLEQSLVTLVSSV